MNSTKPSIDRMIMDSMLIALLLGLLALPILTIGMTGYKGGADVLGADVAVFEAVDEDDEDVGEPAVVEVRTFKIRVQPGTDESTQSVRGINTIPRITEDF
jgi:hypothetical protein